MRALAAGLLLAPFAVVATPAAAQETAPPSTFTVTGGATIVSDYRFRGISQTNRKVAVQATATVTHRSGVYASFWGSTIDDYIANGSDQELDLIAGYSHTFHNGVKLDGGVLYYYYPGGGHANTDFVEPYVDISATYGPVTGKLTANYAPKARALSTGVRPTEDNLYLAGDLSAGIPHTPLSVSGHLGHTFGPSYLSIGDGYTDWNLGASATFNHITVGVSYVDTDKDSYIPVSAGGIYNPAGTRQRNISSSGVVASVGVSF
ncbi:TorF family putative porin [Sphingomonas sp.]|uniref:TorF family putative porin n=1 Tax=Sphingomonas sp. TaxID=28214 RepID=UPI003CC54579